jgi:hypothetical protein
MECSTAPRAARKCFPSRPSLVLRNDQRVPGALARLPEGYGIWRAFPFEPLHISDLGLQPSRDEGRQVRPDLRAPQRTFSRDVSRIVSSLRDLSKALAVRFFTLPRARQFARISPSDKSLQNRPALSGFPHLAEKTKSKDANHSYNPTFSIATRKER